MSRTALHILFIFKKEVDLFSLSILYTLPYGDCVAIEGKGSSGMK